MSHKCHETIKLLLRKFYLIPQITHTNYGICSAPLPECNFSNSVHCARWEFETAALRVYRLRVCVYVRMCVCVCVCVCMCASRKVHSFQVVYLRSPVKPERGGEVFGLLQMHRAEPSL